MIRTIKTIPGNEIVVTEAPDHFENGVLIVLNTINHQPDSKRVEVLLDQASVKELLKALVDFQK